ncbi:MAG: DUF4091 domain-containing protein [Bacteroidaceae bacterium]|nr:DUF4091 domain-containing protein [Bacteroidaceae bacterium]
MKHILSFLFAFAALCIQAQVNNTEPADPKPGPQEAWQQLTQPSLGWGSTDVRYSRSQVPQTSKSSPLLRAWRGERVSAQAVLATPTDLGEVSFEVSDLKCGRNVIPASAVKKYFVRYVMADSYKDRNDTVLVADRLDPVGSLKVEANTARPLWLDIHVPAEAKAGTYKGTVSVSCDGKKLALPLQLQVADRLLPAPSQWSFHLDLWQNPYAVARYFEVPLWSQQHFDLMRPIMELLATAGQKVITCSVINKPWNGQTFDPFESMVGKTKELDGTWRYDYTVFDRWVEFMMSCGITEQIDCYTLVPWHYRFDYYDRATNNVQYLDCKPDQKAYHDFIVPFLKDLSRHLREKGWFSRTYIAMDERPKDQMEAAWRVIQEADPEFKIEGAANYSVESESADRIDDLSVGIRYNLLKGEALTRRTAKGQKITFYTCCSTESPNTFTFSRPAESAYLCLHALACGYDGYLRWAYNSWSPQPNQSSRYRSKDWASGDCYLVYPDGSSIRFERLTEGVQAFEKIRLLRPTLNLKQAKDLDEMLRYFAPQKCTADDDVEGMVRKMNDLLWKLSK